MRTKRLLVGGLSLALVLLGLGLVGLFFLDQGSQNTATNSSDPEGFNVPDVSQEQQDAGGPEDKTLTVTVPKMERIENDTIPDTEGDDEDALGDYAAIHLKGTGFPWQDEANVYLAGHRLGYPGTESFLAFYDLDVLQNGDEVYVADADGKQYTYRVFEQFVVNPEDVWVTEPIQGRNVLTLQTCTLPDYSQRLVVQAELVNET